MSIIDNRVSVRVFNDKEISNEHIISLLKAGMAAPSSKNYQPWSFVVLDDKELLERFSKAHANWKIVSNANKCIVVLGDLNSDERIPQTLMATSAATENILLRAKELGIGSVWLGMYPDQVRIDFTIETLEIPEGYLPISLIALGYSKNEITKVREFNEDKVHYNKW